MRRRGIIIKWDYCVTSTRRAQLSRPASCSILLEPHLIKKFSAMEKPLEGFFVPIGYSCLSWKLLGLKCQSDVWMTRARMSSLSLIHLKPLNYRSKWSHLELARNAARLSLTSFHRLQISNENYSNLAKQISRNFKDIERVAFSSRISTKVSKYKRAR